MIFVDSNIFMYAVGSQHPHKAPCIAFFESIARGETEIATSAEVLQEILYRFWAIKKMAHGLDLFDYARQLSNSILPVGDDELLYARKLLAQHRQLPPRDAVHAATMHHHRIVTIASYDRHFDHIPTIQRWEPPKAH